MGIDEVIDYFENESEKLEREFLIRKAELDYISGIVQKYYDELEMVFSKYIELSVGDVEFYAKLVKNSIERMDELSSRMSINMPVKTYKQFTEHEVELGWMKTERAEGERPGLWNHYLTAEGKKIVLGWRNVKYAAEQNPLSDEKESQEGNQT